ncbi:hypothetical protein CI710_20390 [Aeromonas salmonicida]|nr:hypothetical protein CI710_20390 [Aeromonas salmonicida]
MWPLFFLDKRKLRMKLFCRQSPKLGGDCNMLSAVEVAREMDDPGWLVSVAHWLPLSSLLRIRRQLLSLTL